MNKNNQTAPNLAAFHRIEAVTLQHKGQPRLCYLHTIERADGGEFYFLIDFYGWAIDDIVIVDEAVRQVKAKGN